MVIIEINIGANKKVLISSVDGSCSADSQDEQRNDSDTAVERTFKHGLTRIKSLKLIQLQCFALAVSMPEEQHENSKNCQITKVEDCHQTRHLIIVLDHRHDVSVWQPRFSVASRNFIDQEGEQKLQRIDVEQHYEQQPSIQHYGQGVPQAISAAKLILTEPNEKEQHEADEKRAEPVHRLRQFSKRLRHLERNDQQSNRKREHGIA